MLDKIKYKDVKKYKKYIPFDISTNSRLYYDKDLIHKIFLNKSIDFNIILDMVDKLKLEELVELKKLIYKNDFIVGYSIKNYKEYKSLNKFKKRDFDLKKQDCFNLVKSFDKLLKNNLSYVDFTLSNVLLNSETGDIKICDLDSLILKKSKLDEEVGIKKFLIFILTYVYNINQTHIRNVMTSGYDMDNTFIDFCREKYENITLEDINEIIENIKLEHIKNEKQLIIDRSRYLIQTGYSKFL